MTQDWIPSAAMDLALRVGMGTYMAWAGWLVALAFVRYAVWLWRNGGR